MNQPKVSKSSASTVKIGLCLMLGVGLIVAVCLPPADTEEAAPLSLAVTPVNGGASTDNSNAELSVAIPAPGDRAKPAQVVELPRRPMASIAAMNPFAVPAPPEPPVLETELPDESEPAEITPPPTITAVYGAASNQRGPTALLGDRVIRPGDQLSDGRQVHQVTDRAILVAP